jgi:hypothetical protein
MTKAIMNALDLPVLEDLLKNPDNKITAEDEPDITDEMAEQYEDGAKLEEISTALNTGAVTHDVVEARRERDHENGTEHIYREALQHAKDLMDLGYNVDTRSAKGIFENAASMFKIALDAKNSKRDSQFKQQKLHIENRKVDLIERQIKGAKDSDVEGEAVIVEDRNELIKRMREQAGKNNK